MSQRPYLQIRPGSDQPHFAIAELQAITAPVRAMELCRDGLSNRRDHAVDAPPPRIVQGTAAERRVTRAEDHRAVDHFGIVDDAFAQAGDADVR